VVKSYVLTVIDVEQISEDCTSVILPVTNGQVTASKLLNGGRIPPGVRKYKLNTMGGIVGYNLESQEVDTVDGKDGRITSDRDDSVGNHDM